MADINKLAPKILFWEGKEGTLEGDSGGYTRYGIIKPCWDLYCRVTGEKKLHKDITQDDAVKCLKVLFWDNIYGDKIKDQHVAEFICDWFWNSGPGIIDDVQRVIGVKADGQFGTITLDAANKLPPEDLFNRLKTARLEFIDRIAVGKKARFKKGWQNRVNSFKYE